MTSELNFTWAVLDDSNMTQSFQRGSRVKTLGRAKVKGEYKVMNIIIDITRWHIHRKFTKKNSHADRQERFRRREPEVALVTMNVQDRMNESVASLDGPWTSRMPSCVMDVRKEGRMRGGESQTGQPKGSPALHDSSAGWPVTIVGHFDLAGRQTVICHFVFTVECICENKWRCQ